MYSILLCYVHIHRYQLARSKIDLIFGPKCHKRFPRVTRLEGGGCNGRGFYPAMLDSGDPEYTDPGVDILVQEGHDVSHVWTLYSSGFIVTGNNRPRDRNLEQVLIFPKKLHTFVYHLPVAGCQCIHCFWSEKIKIWGIAQRLFVILEQNIWEKFQVRLSISEAVQ